MDIFDIKMWAGTEEALAGYLLTLKRITADGALTKKADIYGDGDRAERPPRLFSKQGDIGVISISGSLNNSSSWINEYYGMTGYPEIRAALVHAAMQEDIKHIVLDIKSGGGAVSGCSDTGDLIKTIDGQVKPVSSFSDGMIASAAYWLGASARDLTIGKVTEAGSIGVLVMHQEMSRMLAEAGITINVIRSGKFKALGNSMEPLSELGKETIQAQVDEMNDMFVAHVAECRKTTPALVESRMGQGRVFIGQTAMDVGLVDAISNFDTFMSKKQGEIDSTKQQPKYGANLPKGSILKTALTQQAIAAMAAGAVLLETPVVPGATAPVAEVPAPVAEVPAPAEIAPVAETPAANADVVSLLQGQLAAAQGQVVTLNVELQTAKSAAAGVTAAAEKMRPVVRAAVGNLRIALGGTDAGVEALDDAGLLAEHANLAAQFDKKFKAGGVAAVPSANAEKESEVGVDEPRRQARLAATLNSNSKK
jgi:signal peptide peptidase SppA